MAWDLTLPQEPIQVFEITLEPILFEWLLVTTPFPIPNTPPPITPENPNPVDPGEECVEEWPQYGQRIPNPRAIRLVPGDATETP